MSLSTQAPPKARRRSYLQICILLASLLVVSGVVFVALISVLGSEFLGSPSKSRIAATNASAQTICEVLRLYQLEKGAYPSTLAPLVPNYLASAPVDAWRNPFLLTTDPAGAPILTSYGADSRPGGTGPAADLSWDVRTAKPIPPN